MIPEHVAKWRELVESPVVKSAFDAVEDRIPSAYDAKAKDAPEQALQRAAYAQGMRDALVILRTIGHTVDATMEAGFINMNDERKEADAAR